MAVFLVIDTVREKIGFLNLLKSTGYVMLVLHSTIVWPAHIVFMFLYLPENKERLLPHAT
jgi:hypothetical protein